ncbi:hypothetical protein BCR34DRAFT_601726 [Clohesyomyces aquaticus]|uniref:Uncharacterized protein n=1 Tax=Clohesyomyces aquaticus TaxID=1231657 RepID=A0A1Y1ZL36_9PLEO|nr:hypothetical protein BCR34DRAFT_601726 [Clohesyomyces aquaticus]
MYRGQMGSDFTRERLLKATQANWGSDFLTTHIADLNRLRYKDCLPISRSSTHESIGVGETPLDAWPNNVLTRHLTLSALINTRDHATKVRDPLSEAVILRQRVTRESSFEVKEGDVEVVINLFPNRTHTSSTPSVDDSAPVHGLQSEATKPGDLSLKQDAVDPREFGQRSTSQIDNGSDAQLAEEDASADLYAPPESPPHNTTTPLRSETPVSWLSPDPSQLDPGFCLE